MLKFSIKSRITNNFCHQSCLKEVRCQFYLLYSNWTSEVWNLSVNIPSILPRNMSIMGQNRSGDFKAYWEIWFTSGRLLDNQAPRRVKQAWHGGIFTSPDLSRLVAPHVISFKLTQQARYELRRHLQHLCYSLRYRHIFGHDVAFEFSQVSMTTFITCTWYTDVHPVYWFIACRTVLSGGLKWLQTLTSLIVSAV